VSRLALQEVFIFEAEGESGIGIIRLGKRGDFELDGTVDYSDFIHLTRTGCRNPALVPEGCNGRDLDSSGVVEFKDLAILASNWLSGL